MFAAMAYILVFISSRFPAIAVGFLKYDPKDMVIVMCGFIYGPLSAFIVSVTVSFLEMITISTTGWIGMTMNILATTAFASVAALIYKHRKTFSGALIGLGLGCICMTVTMLLWNWLLTPVYTNSPRSEITAMLLPVFLPFNLLKCGLNSGVTLLIYKPVVTALRRARLIPQGSDINRTSILPVIMISIVLITACVVTFLALNGTL